METRTASVQLAEIISEEWESRLRYDPTFATYTGDRRFNDRLQSVTEDDYGQWLDHLRDLCKTSKRDRSHSPDGHGAVECRHSRPACLTMRPATSSSTPTVCLSPGQAAFTSTFPSGCL